VIPKEIIRKKRDGSKLSRPEIESFVRSYVGGGVADYQMSAFLMACYFRGMDLDETTALTEVMLRSGEVLDLSPVPGIKVDKHSTGGVGDKVSLILAPMVAACGVPVPMISGRGLGHTGGTLDKLEAIPGFRTNLSIKEYKAAMAEVGAVLAGQTAEIVPADMKMYALRDVTATVESVPLIAGSIMSKKLAEGIDALVLDVKVGRGAFMKTEAEAAELAKTLIGIGTSFGKKVIGFLTDMNQPLGYAVGNWLEVKESVDCLKGRDVSDLMELTYLLGGAMVMLGGKAASIEEGTGLCRSAIENGKALDKFHQIVRRQGGDVTYLEDFRKYPASKFEADILSTSSGYVGSVDALELGFAAIILGAGRTKLEDRIDPKAGIVLKKKAGDPVKTGEPLAALYTEQESAAAEARSRIERAFSIEKKSPAAPRLIHAMVDERGVHPWPPAGKVKI